MQLQTGVPQLVRFDPHLAERRFGYGRSPVVAPPGDVGEMLAGLTAADVAAQAHPLPDFARVQEAMVLRRRFQSYARKQGDTPEGQAARERADDVLRSLREDHGRWFARILLRRMTTRSALRERLVAFWADHFTAQGRNPILRAAAPIYVEEAVRPHIAGRFSDLLMACVTHPLMLHYLDQSTSAGPNSRLARRLPERRLGLNENLAREVLELHTLGADAAYTQRDVQELAKLLTGLSSTRNNGFKFRPGLTEPGQEIVLGRRYGDDGGIATIRAVMEDLATHPATARHIARKLAVHFLADDPPEAVVTAIEARFNATGGDLGACVATLLERPEAWALPCRNIRPPEEFMSAALRALAPPVQVLDTLGLDDIRRLFFQPLRVMGQPWLEPPGPDGFEESDGAWVTPQGIAARLEWAVTGPARLMEALPDPRVFVTTALGPDAPETVAFAAGAAEERAVAIGLVLASPAFQRR